MDRLKPWQRLPDTACPRCTERATHTVDAIGLDNIAACGRHAADIADELCDQDYGVCSYPARDAWKYYLLYQKYPGRIIGNALTAVHNRRVERLATKAQACPHTHWEGDRCTACGTIALGYNEDDGTYLLALGGAGVITRSA